MPLTFLLGFYVSLVVKRWWEQYCKVGINCTLHPAPCTLHPAPCTQLPWPDSLALFLRGMVTGEGEEPRLVRRTVVRWDDTSPTTGSYLHQNVVQNIISPGLSSFPAYISDGF